MRARQAALIGRSVLVECLRRREVVTVIIAAAVMLAAVMSLRFFGLSGLSKFYRETALKIAGSATAVAVIVLAARQLPREFAQRTIYPLLARPVSRTTFLLGKLGGVLLAALLCLAIFLGIFVAGALFLGSPLPWALLAQHVYLQMLQMLVVASLGFCLSMLFSFDAAVTIGTLFYFASAVLTSASLFLYEHGGGLQRALLTGLNYAVPHLTLLDLSEKVTHAENWPPLGLGAMSALTAYAAAYASVYLAIALWSFRRRPL